MQRLEIETPQSTAFNYRPLSALQRVLLIGLGTLTLLLGVAGMFLPGVPTTVFLLITLACYTRSSKRLYTWVMTRRWLQKPLQTAFVYKEKKALPVRVKLIAQGVAWSSVVLTVFTGRSLFLQLLTIAFAVACTIAMAVIKTDDADAPKRVWRTTAGDIVTQLAYGALAGALGGLISGLFAAVIGQFMLNIAGRAMTAEYTSQLSALVVLFMMIGGVVIGSLFGLLYSVVRQLLPRNKWIHGVAFGMLIILLILIVVGIALYFTPPAQADVAYVGASWPELIAIPIAYYLLNFIAFGLVTSLTFGRLERQPVSHPESRPASRPESGPALR